MLRVAPKQMAHRAPRTEEAAKPVVCLAQPSYDGRLTAGAAMAFDLLATRGACEVVRVRANSSLLAKTFNTLWCAALNMRAQGVTHFAMIHADVVPVQPGWLDILLGELTRLGADVVSAVSPLKGPAGLTSTAVAPDLGDPWLCRRLTLREVYDLPETFGAADVGGPLLLNTGLWVCDLTRPFWDELAADGDRLALCFNIRDRIVRDPVSGEYHAEVCSEDWHFSQELNRRGAKLYATRKVTLGHEGTAEYTTAHPWGSQATDELFHTLNEKRTACRASSS